MVNNNASYRSDSKGSTLSIIDSDNVWLNNGSFLKEMCKSCASSHKTSFLIGIYIDYLCLLYARCKWTHPRGTVRFFCFIRAKVLQQAIIQRIGHEERWSGRLEGKVQRVYRKCRSKGPKSQIQRAQRSLLIRGWRSPDGFAHPRYSTLLPK